MLALIMPSWVRNWCGLDEEQAISLLVGAKAATLPMEHTGVLASALRVVLGVPFWPRPMPACPQLFSGC